MVHPDTFNVLDILVVTDELDMTVGRVLPNLVVMKDMMDAWDMMVEVDEMDVIDVHDMTIEPNVTNMMDVREMTVEIDVQNKTNGVDVTNGVKVMDVTNKPDLPCRMVGVEIEKSKVVQPTSICSLGV